MLGEESHTENITLSGRASGRLASPDVRDEFGLETTDMNMGPQHPAMHGLLRLILELDGETVVRCDPIMGYLHRSKEKISENRMYPAVIPITDRIDYFNNMAMEHGYCLAVEDLLGVEIPPRAEALRVLMAEMSRLMSHIPSIGFLLLELGAFTPILYAFRERERMQSFMEAVTGARMMFHYIRIGGVKADLPEGIAEQIWDYRSEEHTSELQSRQYLVCRLLLEKNNNLPMNSPLFPSTLSQLCARIRPSLTSPEQLWSRNTLLTYTQPPPCLCPVARFSASCFLL